MEATERTPNYPSAIEAVPMNVNVSSLNDDEDFFAFAFGGGEPSSSPSSAAATYLLVSGCMEKCFCTLPRKYFGRVNSAVKK